ncbi:MAG: hypothetical protein AMXMBFR58_28060 [Phycisphaerae bacterium]
MAAAVSDCATEYAGPDGAFCVGGPYEGCSTSPEIVTALGSTAGGVDTRCAAVVSAGSVEEGRLDVTDISESPKGRISGRPSGAARVRCMSLFEEPAKGTRAVWTV